MLYSDDYTKVAMHTVTGLSEAAINLGAQQTNPLKTGKSGNHKEEIQKPSMRLTSLLHYTYIKQNPDT